MLLARGIFTSRVYNLVKIIWLHLHARKKTYLWMDCWRVDSGLVFGMFLIIFNRSKHMTLQICMYPSVAITNHTYTHASDSFRSYVGVHYLNQGHFDELRLQGCDSEPIVCNTGADTRPLEPQLDWKKKKT